MKQSGTCPKCGSIDIFIRHSESGEQRGLKLGWTTLSQETPETYICKNCGYLEEYFTEEQIAQLP